MAYFAVFMRLMRNEDSILCTLGAQHSHNKVAAALATRNSNVRESLKQKTGRDFLAGTKNSNSAMHLVKSMKPRALPTSGLASGSLKNEKSLSGSTFSSCDELYCRNSSRVLLSPSIDCDDHNFALSPEIINLRTSRREAHCFHFENNVREDKSMLRAA
uniref:Uncharacterized protein n=1 Tax=Trichogramma kaykai TaxID=54128 RepID=A0ABD2WG42_9HYME